MKAGALKLVLQKIPERKGSLKFVDAQPTYGSLASSSEVVLAIIDLLKVTVPALIGMIGVVWAAHIANAKNRKGSTIKPKPVVRLEFKSGPESVTLAVASLSESDISECADHVTSNRQVTRISSSKFVKVKK
jgi:hypothetical protein